MYLGINIYRTDLYFFSAAELRKLLLKKAGRWDGNPYPRAWVRAELRARHDRATVRS